MRPFSEYAHGIFWFLDVALIRIDATYYLLKTKDALFLLQTIKTYIAVGSKSSRSALLKLLTFFQQKYKRI